MKIQNIDRLKRKLAAMPRVAKEEIRQALEQSAEEIVGVMRSMVPVDKGTLRSSIGWTWGAPPDGASAFAQAGGEAGLVITIYAGSNATYVSGARGVEFQNAFLQEFGSAKMSANPFFRPAWRLNKKRARGRITRATTKAAKKAAAGG